MCCTYDESITELLYTWTIHGLHDSILAFRTDFVLASYPCAPVLRVLLRHTDLPFIASKAAVQKMGLKQDSMNYRE